MKRLLGGSSWWQTDFSAPARDTVARERSFATVKRVEAGHVHYRYCDETAAGMFSGNDTLPFDEFRAKYGRRREVPR